MKNCESQKTAHEIFLLKTSWKALKKSKIVSIDSRKGNKVVPIIASFQNANINEEMACQAVCKRVQTSTDGSKYALIATETNVYKSDITNPENDYQDTYLAVHNKTTKEIQLVKVQQATFKHVLYDDTRSSFEQNILDSQKILAKDFAGKKGNIAYERSLKTKVNSSILEDAVDKMLDTLDIDKFFENDILEQPKEAQDKFRDCIFPQIAVDADGKSVREIFTTNNLIGDDIIEHLSEISIDILNNETKNLPFSNSYLKKAVTLIQNSKQPDSADNLRKMSMLIYAESLISIINSRKKFLDLKDTLKFSKKLSHDIMKKFFTPGSKQISNYTRQKSIIFYVILTLLCSDSLEVDMNDILDSVRGVSKKELIKFVSVIGCRTKGDILYIQKVTNMDNSTFQVPTMKGKKDRRK